MSHKALARKYRPRSFADVATQGHVSETLLGAVAAGRVGHAYLFCGPRGVGKTTVARVLAMALNCPNRTPEGEPCGECDSCTRIWGGHTSLDVVEIDAASNRGVDDARDLRERAMYAPSAEGRTKVYIVDEAHMLTREAWNALLKILEEPPPSVIFVFATTEPQKIQQYAAPILSRCQRFDFRRIGVSDIVERLETVLANEDASSAPEALRLIARKADGGMRDALSLLDQVLSLTGGDVDADSVRRVLGLVEEERYVELLDILSEGRHDDVFRLVRALVDEGYDLVEFYYGLLDLLRGLLRLRLSPEAEVDVHEELRAQLVERASAFEPSDLVRMLTAAADLESQGSLRRSPNPRLPIEMLLLRLSFLDRTVGLEELLRAMGGAPPADGSAGGGGGSIRPREPGESTSSGSSDAAAEPASAAGTAKPTPPVQENPGPDRTKPRPRAASAPSAHPGSRDAASAESATSAGPATSAPGGPATSAAVDSTATSGGANGTIEPTADETEAWSRWLDHGRTVPRGLGAFLRSAALSVSEEGVLTVRPLPGPAIERLSEPTVLSQIREGLAPFLGRTPAVEVVDPSSAPATARRVTEDEVREDTLKALFRQEPRLERAVEELDLELMD